MAVTRSKNYLDFPEAMFPAEDKALFTVKKKKKALRQVFDKARQLGNKRAIHPNAYKPWTVALDRELRGLFLGGREIQSLAKHFGRDAGAIVVCAPL